MQNFPYLCRNHVQEMRPCMGAAWWIRMLFYWPRVNKYCQHFPRVHWKQNKQTKITYLLLQNYIVCKIICLHIHLLRALSLMHLQWYQNISRVVSISIFQCNYNSTDLDILKINQKVKKYIWIQIRVRNQNYFHPIVHFFFSSKMTLGTIHLRRRHVLGGRGIPMCRWSKGHST